MSKAERQEFTKRQWQWLRQVQSDPRVSSGAFVLAFVLVRYFNQDMGGDAWPSIATLAEQLHKAERIAGSYVSELKSTGHLIVQRRKQRSSLYRMRLQEPQEVAEQTTSKNGRELPNKEPQECAALEHQEPQHSASRTAVFGSKNGNFSSSPINKNNCLKDLSEESKAREGARPLSATRKNPILERRKALLAEANAKLSRTQNDG